MLTFAQMGLKEDDFVDMEEVRAQKQYEQNPEAQFYSRERLERLIVIARDMGLDTPQVYFDYLWLSYVSGYTNREIARLKAVSEKTVRNRMLYSLVVLQRKVGNF